MDRFRVRFDWLNSPELCNTKCNISHILFIQFCLDLFCFGSMWYICEYAWCAFFLRLAVCEYTRHITTDVSTFFPKNGILLWCQCDKRSNDVMTAIKSDWQSVATPKINRCGYSLIYVKLTLTCKHKNMLSLVNTYMIVTSKLLFLLDILFHMTILLSRSSGVLTLLVWSTMVVTWHWYIIFMCFRKRIDNHNQYAGLYGSIITTCLHLS